MDMIWAIVHLLLVKKGMGKFLILHSSEFS